MIEVPSAPTLVSFPPVSWESVIAAIETHKETHAVGGAYTVGDVLVEFTANDQAHTITIRPNRPEAGSRHVDSDNSVPDPDD